MDLKELTKVMPFKWRVQQQNERGATCVAYIDSRQVAERLDEAVGPENWQSNYTVVKDNLYAGIGIWNEKTCQWVWKYDCGTESNTEKEKGEASDAFKRAGVKWGIGRFLYDLDLQRVNVKQHTTGKTYPCDDNGKILWSGDDLTEFINKRMTNVSKAPTEAPRYATPTAPPTYTAPSATATWSDKVTKKAGKVEKDGLKGSAALSKYISEYNKVNSTDYKTITDFKTDDLLLKLIKFVEEFVPQNLL